MLGVVMGLLKAEIEAQSQIDCGLVQGMVIACNKYPELIVLGNQRLNPCPSAMSANSRFDIASVGKVMTIACLARLIDAGLVEIDAPFTTYIPEHALGDSCNISVRDLAMHCSGFDNSRPYAGMKGEQFERELLLKMPLRPRLECFEYSCYNFILLGKIINRISKMDLEQYARKYVWTPLKMQQATWYAPGFGPNEVEHWNPNRPAGEHNDTTCFDVGIPLGNGSCFCNIYDMIAFVEDILRENVFSKQYYRLIKTCAYEKNAARRSFGWDMCDEKRPVGLSKNTIFHSGYTGQTIYIDPDNDFWAVILSSRIGDWGEALMRRKKVAELLFAQ